MKRSSRAWILLPTVIVVIAVIGIVVSNFQKEAGIVKPSPGGVAAVAAALAALGRSEGTEWMAYRAYSESLLVATVARKNAPSFNPADTRLDNLLVRTLDCLSALREAWQAELDRTWDPDVHGKPAYWSVLHPSLEISGHDLLTSADVRDVARRRADQILDKAIDLAS